MDSESPLFSTDGSILSVVCVLFLIFAVFTAVVCLAMVLVTVRRWLVTDDDEVAVLSTDQPPPEVVGRWAPVSGRVATRRRRHAARFVTVVVRSDVFEMPLVIELKQWRMLLAVKLHIYYSTGYLLSRQRLTHRGERLDDFYQLVDYGWHDGQCVELKVDLLVSL